MGYDVFPSTEVEDVDAPGDVLDWESVGGSDEEEVDFGHWLGKSLKVQAETNESHPVFDFTALLLDNDDAQDDAKVRARIDILLRPEIARCYWYSLEADAVIEAATPGLLEQPILCDDGETASTNSAAAGGPFTFQCPADISCELVVLFYNTDTNKRKFEEEERENEEASKTQNIHSTQRPASAEMMPAQANERVPIASSSVKGTSSSIPSMTTDEYITTVYAKRISRRHPTERKSENPIPQNHGLPVTSDESNKKRVVRVERLIAHVFARESGLMTYVSGMTRHLKFTDYQILKAYYRDYVCEKTNQDPDEFVDLMKLVHFQATICQQRLAETR
ncbi:hypothetical protein F4823DRAFT_561071 [Ustulina deusta]|nr:hypothetical protein F4823DRAFT_561071 [Ustulina deusta]